MQNQSPSDNQKKVIVQNQYPDSELTGNIIGCAMEVNKHLGNGFQEVVYQRALSIEMNLQGVETRSGNGDAFAI